METREYLSRAVPTAGLARFVEHHPLPYTGTDAPLMAREASEAMGLLKQQAGAYGSGIEYACTMVHHAPQSAQKPQVVPKKAH